MNNKYNEKIFDLLIADALIEKWDAELQELSENNEYDKHKFSDEFEKKVRKIRNSIGRKDRIKIGTQICMKFVITVATIMGVIFGGLLTQPPVYAAVQNVIRTIFDEYDKYDYIDDELTVENFNNNIRLVYVPEGYNLKNGYYSKVNVTLIYENELNEIIFNYSIANGTSSNYDNEHNSYSAFTINGIEYHYYESNDNDFYDTLVWYKNGYCFSILAQLPKEKLVEIAENVK